MCEISSKSGEQKEDWTWESSFLGDLCLGMEPNTEEKPAGGAEIHRERGKQQIEERSSNSERFRGICGGDS